MASSGAANNHEKRAIDGYTHTATLVASKEAEDTKGNPIQGGEQGVERALR